ncbi:MAG: tRNA (guanosine(46)-N7)-methyltransferase TrmB [Nevskia sp.]
MTVADPDSGSPDADCADARRQRAIRSFVRREGRLTDAQSDALTRLWPRYGLGPLPDGEHVLPMPATDFGAAFGRAAPLSLEIGFGNGERLAGAAAGRPDMDFIGAEVHRPGVGRLLQVVEQQGLANVRVMCADAAEFLRTVAPRARFAEIVLLFPDPWHKTRHHKRRIVQPAFVASVVEALAPGGRFRLATDWAPYAEHMLQVLSTEPRLRNLAADGRFVPRPEDRPLTRFENRGLRLGHEVADLDFIKYP